MSSVEEDNEHLEWMSSCYYYTGILEELIKRFKFSNDRYLSRVFGELFLDELVARVYHKDFDMLITVPLHKKAKRYRGYDQVELMCQDFKNLGIDLSTDNLIKTRQTKEQATIDRKDRKTNLLGAFDIKRPDEIKDKNILLIDDVITTGATMTECAKTLIKNGAKSVAGFSFARS